ncbi:MAG: hypothetical protein JSU06_02245 [Actinobacteria bacterium]|nr:hypothetical protein [Actinomycetota bacterium]
MISARQMVEATGGTAAAHDQTASPGDQLRRARTAISVAFGRAADLFQPSAVAGGAESRSGRLDPAARRRVGESLEGELSDMLEDAAQRGLSEQGARALLLTADIVRWLREGEDLPGDGGDGAIGLLEIHVAIFNGAPHEEERRSQRDLLAVLLALVDAQAREIHGGRWRYRRVNAEAAENRERRKFGDEVDRLRESLDLTIGELATRADLEVLAVVELIYAAREAGSSEIRLLAGALDVEPGAFFSDPPDGAAGASSGPDAAAEDGCGG